MAASSAYDAQSDSVVDSTIRNSDSHPGATDVKVFNSLDTASEVERQVMAPKSRWERSWPVIACGAGLFSDGYLSNVRPPSPVCSNFPYPSSPLVHSGADIISYRSSAR